MINKNLMCYHEIDLDGWCSAAIVQYYYELENKKIESISSKGFSFLTTDYIGWNYGKPIPNWKEYEGDIIISDISFPAETMLEMVQSGKNIIWCDHHISAINNVNKYFNEKNIKLPKGIRNIEYAACELTWNYLFPNSKIPKGVELLGLYDSFRHKKVLPKNEQQKVLEFQYACRAQINSFKSFKRELLLYDSNNFIEKYMNDGIAIYKYICMDAKEEYNKKMNIKIDGFNFCAFNKERFNPINFGIDYNKDGYDGSLCFWYDKNMWNFSFYNDNGKIDCSLIAKKRGGGGHAGASGAKIKGDNLEKSIQDLLNI
jgi:oligoribonuclease NrnB/cAMP/cGMP phosphodiesterase (DHH superfamily)